MTRIKHEYLDRESQEYKDFCDFIKNNHPDPDHVVYTQDKWFWMYRYFMTVIKINNGHAFLEGFQAARDALANQHNHLQQKLKQYEKQNDHIKGRSSDTQGVDERQTT
jgi:hypothetical protein